MTLKTSLFTFTAAALGLGAITESSANDWPRWRGENYDGHSPDTNLMKEWPEGGPEQLWVYDDAGMGYSGYTVVDGKLFTMGTRGEDVTVICIDTKTGKEVWSQKIGEDDQEGYNASWGHGPRSTPTIDGGKVYALGPKGELACLDASSGKKEWSKNLAEDFDGKSGGWGFAESPLVDGDQVVVAPGGKKSGIVALDKDSGKTIWKAEEVQPGKAEYASTFPVELNGTRQYIRLFENGLYSVEATSGDLLWKSEWPGKTAVIPTPIADGNEFYISSGYGVGSKLISVDSDNVTSDNWVNKVMKNHHGGVVKVGEYLYGFSDGGGLICQDWDTGEMLWNEKGQGKLIKGAVHYVDGMLICLNEDDGSVTLVEANSEECIQHGQFVMGPQSENRAPKGKVWTHPLVLNGVLYLRDQENLVAYQVGK